MALLKRYRVEAVFSGHVHHFFRQRYEQTNLYCLPATSFTRQDYAELFRVSAASEFGRDDTGKLHICTVDILKEGHQLALIPTFGREGDATLPPPTQSCQHGATVHLRHPWHESVDLPYNGPMEEFSRKRAHNDYTLMRLLQTGLSNVRVPIEDFTDPAIVNSVRRYHHSGIHFHAMSLGFPATETLQQLQTIEGAPRSLEIVLPEYPESAASIEKLDDDFKRVGSHTSGMALWLGAAVSSSRQHAAAAGTASVFAHTVTSGLLIEDCEYVLGALAQLKAQLQLSSMAGALFQVPWEAELQQAFLQVNDTCNACEAVSAQLVIRLAPSNPANANFDDKAIAQRVSQALALGIKHPALSLQFDTFADIERGYAPRHGFVDRRFNLRPAGMQLAGFTAG
ncbi:MAG: hypothetical protein AAF404_16860 [Pseudomonadota bacterium]